MEFKNIKQGDILEVDLSPVKGHEQDGKRPVVVISGEVYNSKCNGLFIVMPISNTQSNFPMHIPIPKGSSSVTGKVLTQHKKTLDLKARSYRKMGVLDKKTLDVCKKVAISLYE